MPQSSLARIVVRAQQILWITLLLCTALVFSPRYAYAYSDVKYGYAALGCVLFALWPVRIFAAKVTWDRERIWFLLLSFGLLAAAVISRIWAINKYENIKGIVYLAGCVGFGLVAAFAVCRQRLLGKLGLLVSFIVIATSLYGIAQSRGFDFLPLEIVEGLRARYPGKYLVSTFGSGVFAAQYLSPALPFLFGAALAGRGIRRWLAATGFGLGSFYLFLTLSRSGYLAFVAAMAIFSVWAVHTFLRRNRRLLPYVIAAVIAGALALAAVTYYSGMWQRFVLKPDTPQSKSASYRYYIWQDTMRMITEIGGKKGIGYWNYDVVIPKFASIDLLEQQPRTYANERVNRAHSDYLDYWAELGIAGFVLVVCIAAFGAIATSRAIWNGRAFDVGCAAAVVATAVHGLVDFPTYNPASGALFWSLLGACAAVASRSGDPPVIFRKFPQAAVVLPLVFVAASVAMMPWYRYLVSQVLSRDGYALNNARRFQQAITPLRKAQQVAPQNREIYSSLTAALLRVAPPQEAVAATRAWLALEPYFPAAHNAHGAALGQAGETSASLKAFYKSLELAPTNASAHINIANIWYSQQEYSMAADHYVAAFSIDPKFAENSIYAYVHSLAKANRLQLAVHVARTYGMEHPSDRRMRVLEKQLRQGVIPP